MVEFFDLISLFGVAAFFAWLGYAPLQSQLLSEFEGEKREKARQNLYKITDYFFVSFLFYSIAAVSDYLVQYPAFVYDQTSPLFQTAATSFVFGLLTLFVPMLYLRTIGRGGKDLGNINPPPFHHTLFVTCSAAGSTIAWVILFGQAQTILGKLLFPLFGLFSIVGAILAMKYWDLKGWKSDVNLALLTAPIWLLALLAVFVKSYL